MFKALPVLLEDGGDTVSVLSDHVRKHLRTLRPAYSWCDLKCCALTELTHGSFRVDGQELVFRFNDAIPDGQVRPEPENLPHGKTKTERFVRPGEETFSIAA